MPDSQVAARQQDSLTIEYALTRREIFVSFLRSLAQSPQFRRTILLYCVAATVVAFLIRASILRSFTAGDVFGALCWGAGYLVFLSAWVTIRGKTSKRTLSVSPDGIATEIGLIKAQIPWGKVKSVSDASKFVLIARTNGNAFFIPNRAFSSPERRSQFLVKIAAWTHGTT